MPRRKAERIAERVLLEERAEVLRDVLRREGKLTEVYDRKIREIQALVRTGGSLRQVRAHMAELTKEVVPTAEGALMVAGLAGNKAAKKTFRKVFGRRARARFPTTEQALSAASARIRGATSIDNVSLSSRIWKNHRRVGRAIAAKIEASVRAGVSMDRIATELLELNPRFTPPEYVKRLRKAARAAGATGQPNLLLKEAERFQKSVERLGSAAGKEFTLRPAAEQLKKNLLKATPEQIDRHVAHFMRDKAQQHTKMIVRHESVEAYRDSYQKATRGREWTKGYRWTLSPRHPRGDECDLFAGQDLHGLGPGGYPPDEVPETPHPSCLCIQTQIIDDKHFERENAVREGRAEPDKTWLSGKKETSEAWLRRQPAKKRREILGPTRERIFKRKPETVLGKNGVPRPVKAVVRDQ